MWRRHGTQIPSNRRTKAGEFKIIASYIEVEAGWAPQNPSQTKPKQSKTSGGQGVRAVQAQGTDLTPSIHGGSQLCASVCTQAGNGVGSGRRRLPELTGQPRGTMSSRFRERLRWRATEEYTCCQPLGSIYHTGIYTPVPHLQKKKDLGRLCYRGITKKKKTLKYLTVIKPESKSFYGTRLANMKAVLRQSSDTETPSLHIRQAEHGRQCGSHSYTTL